MIETHDLSKKFGDCWAVDGATLRVAPGQVLALLGQNGAGKTTTVRMLTSMLAPTRGWARVAGFDVASHGNEVRAQTGVLTEQHGLYLRMSGSEYLDFFGSLYGLSPQRRRTRRAELLDYFGLLDQASHQIGEYSKGMRQKLALARALLHDPSVLLLDEPTSAMDPESARLVRDEIGRLRSAGRTIVFCTHNLPEAEALADIIVIIHRGRILLQGSLEDLRAKVLGRTEYIVTFSRAWSSESLVLPAGVDLIGRTDLNLRLRVSHPEQSNPLLMAALLARSAPVLSLHARPRTLEQVYLRAMAESRGEIYVA